MAGALCHLHHVQHARLHRTAHAHRRCDHAEHGADALVHLCLPHQKHRFRLCRVRSDACRTPIVPRSPGRSGCIRAEASLEGLLPDLLPLLGRELAAGLVCLQRRRRGKDAQGPCQLATGISSRQPPGHLHHVELPVVCAHLSGAAPQSHLGSAAPHLAHGLGYAALKLLPGERYELQPAVQGAQPTPSAPLWVRGRRGHMHHDRLLSLLRTQPDMGDHRPRCRLGRGFGDAAA
mmetsp:Transcript_79239/g.232693  ORF Transcript_79239/g.232693 Transcript_79239/m.232693 type:complete len:234 (-) Transcript_79239:803-1504(-)